MTHGGHRQGNPTYKLTARERWELAFLAHLGLWPKTKVGEAFGVGRNSVTKAMETYPKETMP